MGQAYPAIAIAKVTRLVSKDVIARRNRSLIAGLLRKSCVKLRIDSAEVYFNAVIATSTLEL